MSASTASLTGQADSHLCSVAEGESLGARVHEEAVEPYLQLKRAARGEGFELEIFSGFRDFDRQLGIWNRKATGQRAVLDSDAEPIDIAR